MFAAYSVFGLPDAFWYPVVYGLTFLLVALVASEFMGDPINTLLRKQAARRLAKNLATGITNADPPTARRDQSEGHPRT